ncbi:lytic murein transglycosylase [Vibrio ulleungensis]|uniref:Lytic murein transglycosylase n=1 Tax=Vibrio ulleungensis TaxID=2807619 RepID=A0ABS2HKC6_9VIBR|nr:lytic murein transglycosylase [Vibrio ulleungensis]MBM7036557.1 lytic murein transglycosylase [Vibrio ulleungensis]
MSVKTIKRLSWLLSALLCSSASWASDNSVEYPEFNQYVSELKKEAIAKGYSQEFVDQAFSDVTFRPRAVQADKNQPEKKLTLEEYLPRAVPNWKVKQANELFQEHYVELNRIGKQYDVQPRFIVALWGVESNFGRLQGSYNVIDALTTMSYEGRREAFFKQQLFAALDIVDQGHISFDKMKGSWAGAMGQPQFMPTSFLTYAVDGNNDGKIDIWSTPEDVFASAANYLSNEGWDGKYTWGRQVKAPAGLDPELLGRQKDKAKTLTQWSELGVTNLRGGALPKLNTDIDAWLIAPDSLDGRTYLVYQNYQTLMHWNRSYYFGLAVSHLADKIK